jgi:CrcB protein
MTLLLVLAGAALGAPARYLVDRAIQARHRCGFPWGTFTVNVSGSFLLGLIAASAMATSKPSLALCGTGFCGAFTTYSTFAYETLLLARKGNRFRSILNALGSVAVGLAAVYLGLLVARILG